MIKQGASPRFYINVKGFTIIFGPLKNGLGVLGSIFIVFADSCHFAKISSFNLRMHSIHKVCTKEKKG